MQKTFLFNQKEKGRGKDNQTTIKAKLTHQMNPHYLHHQSLYPVSMKSEVSMLGKSKAQKVCRQYIIRLITHFIRHNFIPN